MRFKILLVIILCLLNTSCFWSEEGHYGPFKVKVVSNNGEPIKDIVLILTQISPGGFMGHGSSHSYRELRLVNSGEVVEFPRGFVEKLGINYQTGEQYKTLGMSIYVAHPYYKQRYVGYINVPNQSTGTIKLLDVEMIPVANMSTEHFEKHVKELVDKDRSKEYVRAAIKYSRSMNVCYDYYRYLMDMPHDDFLLRKFNDRIGYIASEGTPKALEYAKKFDLKCGKIIDI